MATLVLSLAGQALGAAIGGPAAAILGRAAGALAGQALDARLFASQRTIERPRLADLDVQASTEGSPLPRAYGRVRLSGQVIWATRFEEVVSEERQGGKGGGGTLVRSYAYFANFAVALCEGPVAHVGRIWADGKPLDVTEVTLRTHAGDEAQLPDPLIEAKQGLGRAPAYRGTAYLVFERLPLEPYGNRLPQISVEVIRRCDRLEEMVRAVAVIPGAGEFAYADVPVSLRAGPGESVAVNRHVAHAETDWQASLDELQALCPNLESVALVVAWFGTDLRCGACEIRPAVEDAARITTGMEWRAGGLTRAAAPLVSRVDGRPAYGGTPADAAVIGAIRDLKARGLRVMLVPFVLMDVAPGNGLADPYGAAEQAAYPWRGRVTCDPAPGRPGSPDGSAAAAAQVAGFAGTAQPGDFTVSGERVDYAGPAEWSYRRFALHHAHLAVAAGGVDALLIGSEMEALTRVRDAGGYPFAAALVALAADMRAVVGPGTALSYAANWSEYGGHVPADGSGDLGFPLDPLWAAPEIDFIGIDMYAPLGDWRDGDHADSGLATAPHQLGYLRGQIAGGEDFDWYYASAADRRAGLRTPIADGAHGKPWVFRAKDLVNWWSNPHVERQAGSETTATAWQPRSKPIWLTEFGCPAVDRGGNQPNVFFDPKSAESALPHFSNGARDDLQQRRTLEAGLSWWGGHAEWPAGDNPLSPVYGGPMVDAANIHLWTWDARPFPAFPLAGAAWSDGANWSLGHWLNGRLGGTSLRALCGAVLADFGIEAGDVEIGELDGMADGFVVPGPTTARAVLEQLADLFGFTAADTGTTIRLRPPHGPADLTRLRDDLVETGPEAPLTAVTRAQESELPAEIRLSFTDPLRDHARVSVASRRLAGGSRRVTALDLNLAADAGTMQLLAEARLRDAWAGRNRHVFALPPADLALEPGDVVEIDGARLWVDEITDGAARRIEATSIATSAYRARPPASHTRPPALPNVASAPRVEMLDLPLLRGDEPPVAVRVAAYARPWQGGLSVWRSASGAGFAIVAGIDRPATIGSLTAPLAAGPRHRWDLVNTVEVIAPGGPFAARPDLDVLAGANALAVATAAGWEVLQFAQAELLAPDHWRLSRLLRAQAGTEAEMAAGAETGAAVVLLDTAPVLIDLGRDRLQLPLDWRIAPRGRDIDDGAATALTHAANGVALRPLSPAHPRARRLANGDIALSWIRRTRSGGDAWQAVEVPLGEDLEAYALDILDAPGGAVRRSLTSDTPALIYDAAAQTADFGAPPAVLHIAVAQLSATWGRGAARSASLDV